MSGYAKFVLGVVPGGLLLLTGLAFAGLVSTPYQKGLLISAVLGMCGMIWSLIGYSRSRAALVLVMLLVGVLGVLVGGGVGAISALRTDAYNDNIGSPLVLLLRLLLVSWLILGPAVVGLVQARRAVQALRAVA